MHGPVVIRLRKPKTTIGLGNLHGEAFHFGKGLNGLRRNVPGFVNFIRIDIFF